jgi:hypothetical protein
VNVERVLRNTAATVSVTFATGSTAVEADASVTVTVKKADGTTLLSTTAVNDPAVGVYTVVIPPQASLNFLTLTWTGTFSGTSITIESYVEIVGGFFFSISELRGADSALANATRFPDTALIDARQDVETEFEDICGRAFVPRYAREYIRDMFASNDERGYYKALYLTHTDPIRITGAKVGTTAYTSTDALSWETSQYVELIGGSGIALRGGPLLNGTFTGTPTYVEYEYGFPQVPFQIKQKAIKRARLNLLGMGSTIDPRATTMILPDIGSVNLATPGLRGSETGIPDIDVVLKRYTYNGGTSAGVY